MSVYTLCQNVLLVQSAPGTVQGGQPGANLPTGSLLVSLPGGAGSVNVPSTAQTIQAIVQGSGAITATVQPIVSNDGINWIAYGSGIAITGTAPQTGSYVGTANWKYYSAYLSAVTGTTSGTTVLMNA